MSQKTLFPEPDPDRLDPAIQYATLEDDDPPFGPLLYLQFLGDSLRRERGADIRGDPVSADLG